MTKRTKSEIKEAKRRKKQRDRTHAERILNVSNKTVFRDDMRVLGWHMIRIQKEANKNA